MARKFSGTAQYLKRTDPTGLDPNAAWTFGCWLWLDAYGKGILRVGGPEGGAVTRGIEINAQYGGTIRAIAGTDVESVTAFGTGAWKRLVVTRDGPGTVNMSIYLDGSGTPDASYNTGPPGALATGDVLKLGDGWSPGSIGLLAGRMAWPFWLQGVALSGAASASYLNAPCGLVTDYGAGGGVVADALKFLFPLESGDPTADISGVGNTLTDTSTTDVSNPSGPPLSCVSATAIPVFMNQYRQRGN